MTDDCLFWSSPGAHPQGVFKAAKQWPKPFAANFRNFRDAAARTEGRTALFSPHA